MRPVVFHLGPVTLYPYGLALAVAFLLGTVLLWRRAAREEAAGDWVLDMITLSMVTGVAGARLAFVLLNLPWYLANPWEIINIREGGLTLYGGLLLACLADVWYLRRKGINSMKVADWAAPALAFGVAVTRLGCFYNGCCYGQVAGEPWGVECSLVDSLPRFPTQLYESAGALGLGLVLLWLDRRFHRGSLTQKDGRLFAVFLAGYGLIRFVVEVWRENDLYWGVLSVGQWASLVLMAAAVAALLGFPKRFVPARPWRRG